MDFDLVNREDPPSVHTILESLPGWFGDREAIENYVVAAADERFQSFLAVASGQTVAVALVARHFPEAAELHLIAVASAARGNGIGRALVDHIAAELSADGCRFISVHTVGPSFDNVAYAETREFYRRTGFLPLEEHHGLDWPGPSLILVRVLA